MAQGLDVSRCVELVDFPCSQKQACTRFSAQTKAHQESAVTKRSRAATCGESQHGRTVLLQGSLHPHCPGCPRRRGDYPQTSVHSAYIQWDERSLHSHRCIPSAHLLKRDRGHPYEPWYCSQEGAFHRATTGHSMLQLTALARLSPDMCGKTQGLTIAAEGLIEGLVRVCGGVAVPVLQQWLSSL